MGMIQSAVNQMLSVGAIMARVSEPLQTKVKAASEAKAIAQKESEIATLSEQQKKDEAYIQMEFGKLRKEASRLKELPDEARVDREARYEKRLQKLFARERTSNVGAVDIAGRELDLAKGRYELDKSAENLLAIRTAEGKLSEARYAAEKMRRRQGEHEKELSKRDKYRAAAQTALNERRAELGDRIRLGRSEITERDYPDLYKKITEQLSKEGS